MAHVARFVFACMVLNLALVTVSEAFELNCTVNGQSGGCAPYVPGEWWCGAYDFVLGDATPVCGYEGTGNGHCPVDSQATSAITTIDLTRDHACSASWSWEGGITNLQYDHGMLDYFQHYFDISLMDSHFHDGQCVDPNNFHGITSCERDVLCPAGYTNQLDINSGVSYCFRAQPAPDPNKNKGCCNNGGTSPSTAYPISIGTGNKFLSETDIAAIAGGLEFRRSYNSLNPSASTVIGTGWQHNYNLSLDVETNLTVGDFTGVALATRGDGRVLKFSQVTGSTTWTSDADIADRLVNVIDGSGNVTGHQFIESSSDRVETYNLSGQLTAINDSRRAQTFALTYDANNILTTVTDRAGRQLQFGYDGQGRIKDVFGPDLAHWQYAYDASNNLTLVTTPTGTTRVYAYENTSYPSALTGITDENGVRYVTYAYDTQGRASSENLWSGAGQTLPVNQFALLFPATNQTLVTDPLSTQRTYQFEVQQGSIVLDSVSQPCTVSICGAYATIKSRSYDPTTGLTSSTTDFNGNTTTYAYDTTRDIETQHVEASGTTSQRTIATVPDPNFHVPDQRTVANASGVTNGTEALTKWFYNARGQVLFRCEIDPAVSGASSYACNSSGSAPTGVRKWSYTYCEQADVSAGTCPLVGLNKSIDGPRTDVSDVTTFTYYQTTDESGCATLGSTCHHLGDLQKVTNAVGQITTYASYNKNGGVTRMQDVNGTYTDMTYHARGWLLTRTVRANANGTPNSSLDATTTFAYDNVGNVTRVTQPDGTYLQYVYDAAHRLTDIYDSATPSNYLLGDHISYTLDAAGNRTDEATHDPGGNLKRELSRNYDSLNRLIKIFNFSGAVVQSYTSPPEGGPSDGYDPNGNAIYSVDGTINHVGTEQQYDPLNRLVKTLQDHAGTGATHDTTTQYAYDARSNLRSVIDPDNLTTGYTYDGLNNLTDLNSPDTGHSGYTYDAAGNQTTQTDARGIVTNYSYDALNRLTGIVYPTTSLNVVYSYDQSDSTTGCNTSYPKDRLTRMTDSSGTTTYCYDQRGNTTTTMQVTGAVELDTQYTYTLADRLDSITYPNGDIVTYGRDNIGRIVGVDYLQLSGPPWRPLYLDVPVVNDTSYYPFGPAKVITYGNGRTLTKSYDQDYAIDSVVSSDPNGLIVDANVDVLGNLRNASSTVSASPPTQQYQYDPLYRLTAVQNGSGTSLLSFAYDLTGDRTSKTPQGQGAQSYAYASATHHLASVAGASRSYDLNGNTQTANGVTFTYDDRNRLSAAAGVSYKYNGRGERVSKGSPATLFVYANNGQLLGEYDSSGVAQKQYISMDGVYVGVVADSTLYYIETDQLGTPRAVVQPGDNTADDIVVWKWDYFANNSAFGENTPSVQTLTFNLRFPGQYFDSETGLNYNYFRDYEPGTGRYVESDPIGLSGGPNSYSYSASSPLRFTDTRGLASGWPDCDKSQDAHWEFPSNGPSDWRKTCVPKPPPRTPPPPRNNCPNGVCRDCIVTCYDENGPNPWIVGAMSAMGWADKLNGGELPRWKAPPRFSFPVACLAAAEFIDVYAVATGLRCVAVCNANPGEYR